MKIIAIEGPDGVGKTTQTDRLKRALIEGGKTVCQAHPLNDTEMGSEVRRVIQTHPRMCPAAQLALFSAAHIQFFEELADGSLLRGKDYDLMLLDRSPITMMAYQRGATLEPGGMKIVQGAATYFNRPDGVFVLELSPTEALKRDKPGVQPEDQFEGDIPFQQALRQNFRDVIMSIGDIPAIFIDASPPIAQVHEVILESALKVLDGTFDPLENQIESNH